MPTAMENPLMRGQKLQHGAETRRTDAVCTAEPGKFRVVLADSTARNYFPSKLEDFSTAEAAMEAADKLNQNRLGKDTELHVVYNDRGEEVVPEKLDGEMLN